MVLDYLEAFGPLFGENGQGKFGQVHLVFGSGLQGWWQGWLLPTRVAGLRRIHALAPLEHAVGGGGLEGLFHGCSGSQWIHEYTWG